MTTPPEETNGAASRSRVRVAAGVTALIAVWAFVWLALWAVGPTVLGWRPVVITSDSMRPAIETGDVVVGRPHSGTGLGAGTVIIFDPQDGRGLITHRIAGVNPDGTYITRGDANGVAESTPLAPDQVVAVGTLRVPMVGLPVVWLQHGEWLKLLVLAAALAYAVALAGYALHNPRSGPGAGGSGHEGGTGPRESLSPSPSSSDQRRPIPSGALTDHLAPAGERHGLVTDSTDPWGSFTPQIVHERRGSWTARLGSAFSVLLLALVVFGGITLNQSRAAFVGATTNEDNTFTAWTLTHDVAVTDLCAPATARNNEQIAVVAEVANLGTAGNTFDVEVWDVTRNNLIGSATVTLGSGVSDTLSFNWTPGGPAGERTLQAEAILATDEDLSNNVATTTILITTGSGGSAPPC